MAEWKKKLYFVVAGYFRFFANWAFKRWNPRVIAITGSAGKTTMLNLLECQLGRQAHYSHNANSAYGVAFDMVGLSGITDNRWRWLYLMVAVPVKALFFNHEEAFYVVEIDSERPREAEFVAEWLKPEVCVWVSAGMSHVAQFEQAVAAGIFKNLEEAIGYGFAGVARWTSKLVLIDGDNELMKKSLDGVKAEVREVTQKQIKKYEVTPHRAIFTMEKEKFEFNHAEPKEVGMQILMMQEVMRYLHKRVKTNLVGMRMAPGRSSVFTGVKKTILIDSTYNAHMISMESILEMARMIKKKNKWLVIGDIVEQGKMETKEHKRLGELIVATKAKKVVLVGRRTKKWTAPVLKKAGMDFVATEDVKEALEVLEAGLAGGEVIVFKGSQYLEWLVEKLLADPNDALKLARRNKMAMRRRKKRGLK